MNYLMMSLTEKREINAYKTAMEFKEKPGKAYTMVFSGSECVNCG